jgi:EAL domain-containing protein (putative c-di-GMP-specific phosphodiesterase class I)
MQGYLLSVPLPAGDIAVLLREHQQLEE